MKKSSLFSAAVLLAASAFAQDKIAESIKAAVAKPEIEAHVVFLAADEMRGRDTGSPEAAITANYLAANFAISGLKKAPGMSSYFQEVGLQMTESPKTAVLKVGADVFALSSDLLVMSGDHLNYTGDFVFVGYGSAADFNAVDVKGKVVVANLGSSESSDIRSAFMKDSPEKYKLAKEKGAAALVELVVTEDARWGRLNRFFGGGGIGLAKEDEAGTTAHLWLRKKETGFTKTIADQKKATGSLTVERPAPKSIPARNVIGLIEGTDPKLKNEYIVLSAHYDHIGVQKNGTNDSIYNGARDNALGTTAVLEAAKYIAKHPTKRSVLVIGYTGEEKGLLGSAWYAAHPIVPLNKTVYNLDCDGAGYNDKTIITLIDLNRTNMDEQLKKGVAAFGLKLTGDPVPDQNLYERSDNYNFAVKGVPAVDFAPGIKTFDEELNKYYHQAADEASSLDFEYVEKYVRSYVYASWLVGNSSVKPAWKPGDKFEATGKTLYGEK